LFICFSGIYEDGFLYPSPQINHLNRLVTPNVLGHERVLQFSGQAGTNTLDLFRWVVYNPTTGYRDDNPVLTCAYWRRVTYRKPWGL